MSDARSPPSSTMQWQTLRRRTLVLLGCWFVGGPLCGILLVDRLNVIDLGGAPLGFWIAQQGSIYLFVLLIFANAVLADRAERVGRAPAASRERRAGGAGMSPPPATPPDA
jgi:putative solute:sodium symporter small subunit